MAEAAPRSRRPAAEGSDPDSDPDVERGLDDTAEPLLHASGKAHQSPAPNAKTGGSFRSDSSGSVSNGDLQLQLQLAKEDSRLEIFKSIVAIVVWYSSNIGLLLLNKYMLSGFGFRRPVFLTLWCVFPTAVLCRSAVPCIPLEVVHSPCMPRWPCILCTVRWHTALTPDSSVRRKVQSEPQQPLGLVL